MRISPLHTAEFIGNQIIGSGRYDPARMTGRSTAQALRYLAQAIDNPGIPVQIIDHAGMAKADRHTQYLCFDIANRLGLSFINEPSANQYRGKAYIQFG